MAGKRTSGDVQIKISGLETGTSNNIVLKTQKIYTRMKNTNCNLHLKTLIAILLLSTCFSSHAQTDPVKLRIDSLRFVTEVPYACESARDADKLSATSLAIEGCGGRFFWNVVQLKDKAIPYLIELLDDNTEIPAIFPYQGGQCTMGKIAYIALEEIIHDIPTAELLGVNPDDYDCGYCYYHLALRKAQKRKHFQKAVANWYETHKNTLVWVANQEFDVCDCSANHPVGGHYEVVLK